MTTKEKFEELAEVKIFAAKFKPDKRREIPVNVRLATAEEFRQVIARLDADPVAELQKLFLDPNTGEKLFDRALLNKMPKLIHMKLARLYIEVNTGRYIEEE